MVVLVATPSLLLPGFNDEATQVVALLAIFAALFVLVEYSSVYPGLIEFRDAPPFNRVRFLMLFATLFLLSVSCQGKYETTELSRFVEAIGMLLGYSVDLPFSPIRFLLNTLPEGTTRADANAVRTAAGLAYLVALVSLTLFAILIRLRSWPSPTGSFNVWINLPTFDPTASGDVVKRLNRDARINILLGCFMPYITPPLASLIAGHYGLNVLGNDLALVWSMALWAFLPASLFLRGIAMRRIAVMIEAKRRRLTASLGEDLEQLQPAY